MSGSRQAQIAILAGGMGTRLKARTGDVPKPMAPILGKPVLEHLIVLCRESGFKDIALLVHYQHEAISGYFGNGSGFGVNLIYCVEQAPRGTAGALFDALPVLAEDFIVLYGDTYVDADLNKLWKAHLEYKADATIVLHPNDHPYDSDLVEIDQEAKVVNVHPYPHPDGLHVRNLGNAALYVMKATTARVVLPAQGKADLVKHSFPAMLERGCHIQGYVTPEYIKDMGTPDRLDKVEADVMAGLPERLSSRNPRSAVFIDRDGTINKEIDHLNAIKDLELIEGSGEAIRELNRSGWLAIGITNQPVIARGELTFDGLKSIHGALDHQLGLKRAYLDAMYFCPHHPDKGFEGEIETLKIKCECRKPAAGMIDQAVRDYEINRRSSWMVGDVTSDMLAGSRAGLRTILVRTGYAGQDGKYNIEPDYISNDLAEAVKWVRTGHTELTRKMISIVDQAWDSRVIAIGGPARSGKTTTAQVVKELLSLTGKKGHVISLDGWLKPVEMRSEGKGVLERYDLREFLTRVEVVLVSSERMEFEARGYNRKNKSTTPGNKISIGPEDVLIIEGVPALSLKWPESIRVARIHCDANNEVLKERIRADYRWREQPAEMTEYIIKTRFEDEVEPVREMRYRSDFTLEN